MNKTEREIFSKAIHVNGSDEQMRVAQEECAELIQALSKYHRTILVAKSKRDHRYADRALKNIKEEMADVQIMLDQLQMIFGITKKELDEIRAQKVERLSDRLSSQEEE